MTLKNKNDRAHIRRIVQSNVESTLAGLDRFIVKEYWIGKSNRYSKNTIERIKHDFGKTLGPHVKPNHLSQYIAASCLLHFTDGWSYLGKAIHSLLRGDPHRARHLAYYAELRAAMSLLASEGVGIFQEKHFVIDGPRSVTKVGSGQPTHRFVWDCLEYWSTLSRSGSLFAAVVTPHGRTLDEWFAPIGGTNVVAPQAQKWFRQWGMDIRMPMKDRDARNESSYRPDGIPDFWHLNANDALSFSADLWEVLGITGDALFSTIDSHILRIALESAFRGLQSRDPVRDAEKFGEFISKVIEDQNFDAKIAEEWKEFLLRKSTPKDPSIFTNSRLSPQDPNSGQAVSARAALFLRLAAGSVLRLMMAAGLSGDRLRFWWSQLGTGRGLWTGAKAREELADLWADVSVLLERVRIFQGTTPPAEQTFYRVGTELAGVITGLAGCERFAIWSMTA